MENLTGFNWNRILNDNGSLPLRNFSFFSGDEQGILEEHCKEHNQPDALFAGFVIFIVAVGLAGNLLVFSTIVILREYKNSITNWYILQLTIADTLFLSMLPLTAHSEMYGMWNFSLTLCKFKEAVIFINYYASIYFLVVMSFDRYLAVNEAFDSNSWMTKLRKPVASYAITAFGWTISVLLCIQLYTYSNISDCQVCSYNFPHDKPLDDYSDEFFSDLNLDSINFGDYTDEQLQNFYFYVFKQFQQKPKPISNLKLCKFPESYTLKVWIYGNFIGAFCVPFILICFFYGIIMTTISSASINGNASVQRSYKRRVTLIVLALVTLFAVSWIPWYVDKILRINGVELREDGCRTLRSSVRGLAYLNSALNPYFYGFLGTHFRDRLQRVYSRIIRRTFKSKVNESAGTRRCRVSLNNTRVIKCFNKQNNRRSGEKSCGKDRRDARRSSLSMKTERTII